MLTAAACTRPGSPVPIRGEARALVGEWEGEYSSPDTGRHGSIWFHLTAGADTASGDVLMTPRDPRTQAVNPSLERAQLPRPTQVLTISFVTCSDDMVVGRMDSYTDPVTGRAVWTTFEGKLSGKYIKGTYESYVEGSNERIRGTWQVKRRSGTPPRPRS
jgi:hypothetical protein